MKRKELLTVLKFESTAKVGDLIKAFDFKPSEINEDAYVVGIVREKGWVGSREMGEYMAYTIEVVYDTEKYSRVGMKVYVPYEVTFEYDNRVTKV